MDRASRFIWELSCGKKDRSLFENAIETLAELVVQTMLIRLTHTRPSLCLEPDAHVRISANDVAWSACQSESHSSSSSCMCQPYKHGSNERYMEKFSLKYAMNFC
jgi:hypothetical protein